MICPLCGSPLFSPWKQKKHKPRWSYYLCGCCGLVSRDPHSWPSIEEEKRRYTHHQNSKEQAGYRNFLGRMVDPFFKLCPPPASLLDFGCGPEPVLRELLRDKGYTAKGYDPQFAPNKELLRACYDGILSTEVFEHLHEPDKTMDQICKMLAPGGILAVMTQLVPREGFETWHYLSDVTHVIFFSRKTFTWMAEKWGFSLVDIKGDLVFMRSQS